ncbi:MAG: Uma2 family endonuclease [Chitinophagaceae bacterium]|nr:Uma2 family endonuclease [Chitinophagaceae bacterium]
MVTRLNQLDTKKKYSYADYLTWWFEERVELIKGKIFKMSPAPSSSHQRISFELARNIGNFLQGKECKAFSAPFDVRLSHSKKSTSDKMIFTVVQPDICVIYDSKKIDEKGCIGAPDWIIEILSNANTKHELQTKFSLYEENKIKEYWMVSPFTKSVQVFDYNDKKGKYEFRKNYAEDDKVPVGIFKSFKVNLGKVFTE